MVVFDGPAMDLFTSTRLLRVGSPDCHSWVYGVSTFSCFVLCRAVK